MATIAMATIAMATITMATIAMTTITMTTIVTTLTTLPTMHVTELKNIDLFQIFVGQINKFSKLVGELLHCLTVILKIHELFPFLHLHGDLELLTYLPSAIRGL